MDVVRRIRSFNTGRDPERLQLKYRAMRKSPFAFLRGTCHLFYERLPKSGVFKSAPPVWACGDLHLENFGSYKADNRLVYFDINDFDESALAPASWDLVRMLTSIRVGAAGFTKRKSDAQHLCTRFLDAYASALVLGKAYWVERDTAQGAVKQLLETLRGRQRSDFLDTRTQAKGKRRSLLTDGEKALPASKSQRKAVTAFMASFAKAQADPDFYEVHDVARHVGGLSSLGIDRFVILVRGKGSPDGNYLLDLKQSRASSLVPQLTLPQPRWKSEAHRAVALQRRVQAVSMAFLHPVQMSGAAYVIRGLQASEDRVALQRLDRSEIEQLVGDMGRIVAWGQLRSAGREGSATADELIAFGRRMKWKDKLLGASQACAEWVFADSASFNAAYDEGALAV